MQRTRGLNYISALTLAIVVVFSVDVFAVSDSVRGTLLQHTLLRSQTKKSMDLSRKVITSAPLPHSKNAVDLYRIRYATIDTTGKPTEASGLVIVPKNAGDTAFPLLSYHHGTALAHDEVPSRAMFSVDAIVGSILFGSMGYVVSAADYLGLGDSAGLHPYLHAESEATVTADMLEATKQLVTLLGIKLNGKLFLTGYSQGGHVTMALHRYLENKGIAVTASAPMGGPYDLSDISLRAAIEHPSSHSTFYAAYLYMAMRNEYKSMGSQKGVVRTPYSDQISNLFTGDVAMQKALEALPDSPKKFFTEKSIDSLLGQNQDDAFVQALQKNNVYDWKPRAPVLFLHAHADTHVPYANAERAYEHMNKLGAEVYLKDVGEYDHIEGALPAFWAAYQFFETNGY